MSSDLAERRSDFTSPVFGGIGPWNTSIEEVPQARGGGLRGKWARYLRGGGKEFPIRHRQVTLLLQARASPDESEARRRIADALPEEIADSADSDALEAMRRRLAAAPVPRLGLGRGDFEGALGVFVLVVAPTFPVVVPFLVIDEPEHALRVSNFLGLVTLFIGGATLGGCAGWRWWRSGLAMTAVGVVLVAVIIALGG